MAITLDGTNGITTPDLNATGEINADTISNEAGTGAPNFPNGLSVNSNPLPTAGSLSNRNKIINGNFDIWQRGTSGSSGYVADRWQTILSGSTAAITQQAFTLGQTDVPNEPKFFHRTVVTSVAGSSNYAINIQRIEGVRTLAGQTATLSFWAKADATKSIAVEFTQYFGTGGSPSVQVNSIGVTTIALTTAWQKFTVTASVPSISGKTLGTDNNDQLILLFWLDAGSDWNSRTNSLGQQSGTFDIAQVQLEAGDTATPFEHRSYGQELALCQRYYQNTDDGSNTVGLAGNVTSGLNYHMPIRFPVAMRAAPTMTYIPWAHLAFGATVNFQRTGKFGTNAYATANATNTAGYWFGAYTASAEL